jgi:hypothetical protein
MRAPLFLPLLAAACASGSSGFRDHEAFQRALSEDPQAQFAVGSDAEVRLVVKEGEPHYIAGASAGAPQVHMYSPGRDRTSILDSHALRRNTAIVILAQYQGPPPPTP